MRTRYYMLAVLKTRMFLNCRGSDKTETTITRRNARKREAMATHMAAQVHLFV